MDQNSIIQLDQLIGKGQLFYNKETDRIEGYIPTPYPSNHAPGLIELENGDILCTWFGGSDEGNSDIKIAMSRLDHDSSIWSEPVQLSNDYERAEQNPSLFQESNGNLRLIHTAMETRGCSLEEWKERLARKEVEGSYAMQDTSMIRSRISTDNGRTWGEPFIMFDKPGSFCRHPIEELSNGDWIFPVWYSHLDGHAFGNDYSAVKISEDKGKTWTEYPVPGSTGRVHMSIVEIETGRLVAFFRSRAADRIYMTRSNDYGRTWSEVERTVLPNNNASIRAIKLQSGHIAIVFNHFQVDDNPNKTIWPYERYPVTIAISEDEGLTWPYMRHIETGDNYCGENNMIANRRYEYPTLIQAKNGLIHIAYAYATRQCIKHVCITEDWIRGAEKNEWPWASFPLF